MRLRLGLLQDAAAIEKQAAREAADAKAAKHKQSIPTVKTEAQMKADEKAAEKAAKEGSEPAKKPQVRIRPLSEAKAVESGATFISETFLFSVAAALIFFESWRSRRKETSRREDVADRLEELEESEKAARRALVELEREVLRLRARDAKLTKDTEKQPQRRILPREIYEVEEKEEKADEEVSKGWLSRISSYITRNNTTTDAEAQNALETNSPGPAEKILKQAEAALQEKHKQATAEATAAASTGRKTTDTSGRIPLER
jgi:hypothetical protein